MLPYFLGAADDDPVSMRAELRRLRGQASLRGILGHACEPRLGRNAPPQDEEAFRALPMIGLPPVDSGFGYSIWPRANCAKARKACRLALFLRVGGIGLPGSCL